MGRYLLLAAIIFTSLETCLSQAIVPQDVCERNHISCPGPENKRYETYCCLARNEYGSVVSYCCNPYVGLYIGLGVGVPLLLVIVVAVIMLYVCWSCYHRKQMRYLTRVYVAQTAASTELSAVENEAPPAYTPDDENKDNGRGLPMYTEDDPFPDSSHPPPLYLNEEDRTNEQQEPTEGERAGEENSTSSLSEETTADDQPLIT